jgi:hypothetical protein
MGQWSQAEASRTIDEIKRRSLTDPGFRALALLDAVEAIARVNPKPLPAGVCLRFVASKTEAEAVERPAGLIVVELPSPVAHIEEMSDAELDQAVGGVTEISFPVLDEENL